MGKEFKTIDEMTEHFTKEADKDPRENVVVIDWTGDRYEMTIQGKLKSYTQNDHEVGKKEMIRMAEHEGYVVELKGDE